MMTLMDPGISLWVGDLGWRRDQVRMRDAIGCEVIELNIHALDFVRRFPGIKAYQFMNSGKKR